MTQKIVQSEARTNQRIDQLEEQLTQKIAQSEARADQRIGQVILKLDDMEERLRKLEQAQSRLEGEVLILKDAILLRAVGRE